MPPTVSLLELADVLITQQLQAVPKEEGRDSMVLLTTSSGLLPLDFVIVLPDTELLGNSNHPSPS